MAVARERSFMRAAARLGMSTSSLSHLIRKLELRLEVRLLARTTRSVSATEAGQRLLSTIGPRLEEVQAELSALRDVRNKPSGAVRITSTDYATDTVLWPRLKPLLRANPGVKVEFITEYELTDIVAQRYDAGVRAGEQVAKDMIAVRIGPDIRMAVVGAPSYLRRRPEPRTPHDLLDHSCVNPRLPTQGRPYAWKFEKDHHEMRVRVEGQLSFNGTPQMLNAALAGFGLAYLPQDLVQRYLGKRQLKRVLEDWCPPYPGYHLYYPSRRRPSAAFALIVNALRYRA